MVTQQTVDDAFARAAENGYDMAYFGRQHGVEQLTIDLMDKDADFEHANFDDVQKLVQDWLDRQVPHG